jgi:hypothetical protein
MAKKKGLTERVLHDPVEDPLTPMCALNPAHSQDR